MKRTTPQIVGGSLAALIVSLVVAVGPAQGQIVGFLEAPGDSASGISNIQGWTYTQTPGASLIQPFQVLINGEPATQAPCCGNRGDVKDANPDAPLATAFSTVFNWGLVNPPEAMAGVADPGGIVALVQVVVTDDMGGSLILSRNVTVYNPAPFAFSKRWEWDHLEVIVAEGPLSTGPSSCVLLNDSAFTTGAASLACENLVTVAPDDSTSSCRGTVLFSWDRASQSFKASSDCITTP